MRYFGYFQEEVHGSPQGKGAGDTPIQWTPDTVRLLGRQLGAQAVLKSLPPQTLLTTPALCRYGDPMPLSESGFSTAPLLPADAHGSQFPLPFSVPSSVCPRHSRLRLFCSSHSTCTLIRSMSDSTHGPAPCSELSNCQPRSLEQVTIFGALEPVFGATVQTP